MAKTMVTEAVRRKRVKHGTRNASSTKPKALLKEGDWLDVMDGDGVWNVARVLSVPSPEEVEITYDGWPEEYDEVVYIDSDRVAPYHTFTSTVKCWVKYLNWPLWPSLITIRTPGTPEGIRNLAIEHRLYVDFLDNPNFVNRDRCWQKRRQVRTFEDNYDKKRTGSTGEHFERALGWVLQSDALTKMPKFDLGTLPAQYKLNPTESVEAVRRRMGDALWFQSFTHNRMRHQQCHVYETIGDEEDDAASDDSAPQTLNERWLNLSALSKKSNVFREDTSGVFQQHSTDMGRSLIPTSKIDSSDSEESKDSSGEKEVESFEHNIEQNEDVEKRDVKDSAAEEMTECQTLPDASANDNDNESRQRCCVMQADKNEPQRVDTTAKVKSRKRTTTIIVPRKFDKPSDPQVPDCCTNSMLRPAPPPHLRVSASDFRARAALASPSTQVFSSSKGFSMESWFKRKLMADFMNGGPLEATKPK